MGGPCITLSHYWGEASILKSTRANLDTYKQNLDMDELPKTFTDANAVARYLKTRYLWIDSLAIIQDCAEDWAREATTMDRVYQNAFCNIGATAAHDSHEGLFYKRIPGLLLPQRVVISDRHFQMEWMADWHHAVKARPLLQRGWIVQEQWMCQRMIHFGPTQLF